MGDGRLITLATLFAKADKFTGNGNFIVDGFTFVYTTVIQSGMQLPKIKRRYSIINQNIRQ